MFSRPFWALACGVALLVPAAPVASEGAPAEPIWIVNNTSIPGCVEVKGVYVGILVPGQGLVLLSTQHFPSAAQVGELRGKSLTFNLEGVGQHKLETAYSYTQTHAVWGSLDEVVDVGKRTGCIAFDRGRFSDIDDFRTYLNWLLKEIYYKVAPEEGGERLALRISSKSVALSVTPEGYRAVRNQVKEGGLFELRLRDQDLLFGFLPVILDEETGLVAVKVYEIARDSENKRVLKELQIVTVEGGTPGVTLTEPSFELRIEGIQ